MAERSICKWLKNFIDDYEAAISLVIITSPVQAFAFLSWYIHGDSTGILLLITAYISTFYIWWRLRKW